jgi:cardiolipin synthase
MQRLMKNLFSRAVLFSLAILIQFFILVIFIWKFSNYFVFFYGICALLSLVAVLVILNGRSNPAYKIAWIVPIMIFPIFGGLFYLMFGGNKSSSGNKRKMEVIGQKVRTALGQDLEILHQLEMEDRGAANQTRYIDKFSSCPVYTGTISEYLTPGEVKFVQGVGQ